MHKAAPLAQIKAGPDDGLTEGQFTAYASVFGNKDSYGDVVEKGAFAASLTEWAAKDAVIPLLYGHRFDDPDMNVGWIVSAEEDDHGLKVTGQLDLDNPKAMQVYRLVKGRRVSQMSFAYDVVDGGPAKSDELGDHYVLRELKLYEVSIVPIGANDQTEILAVKHLTEAVKAGRVLSAKNETALRDARDAIDSVLASLGDDGEDQGAKASGDEPVTEVEPDGAKSTPEPMRQPSVDALLAAISIHERS